MENPKGSTKKNQTNIRINVSSANLHDIRSIYAKSIVFLYITKEQSENKTKKIITYTIA